MKAPKKVIKKIIEKGLLSISFLDSQYLKKDIVCESPPVFIIGAPRSGTTLLYQMMLNSFRFAYLPNISNYFYTCPVFAAKAGLKIFPKYESSFRSQYGYEKGLMSPSEAGNIWNRWFPNEKTEGYNYTPSGYLEDKSKADIYRLVAWFQEIFKASFISKNLKMSVRLQTLQEIFPEALFVKCNRTPADTAYSILKIRRSKKTNWWSVMPKEIESIKLKPEIEQVCNQVYFIDKNIHDDIQLFNSKNIINIDYKNICENPAAELDKLFTFFKEKNVEIQRNSESSVSKIKYSGYRKNDGDDYLQINKILASLYSKDSK
jgi:sulfotransferase family protein